MKTILSQSRAAKAAILLVCVGFVVALYADPVSHGKDVFDSKCAKCHTLDKDKEGPRLRDIFGRRAASVSSFEYSDALKAAKITWDEASLNTWLTDPDKMVPDNNMAFHLDSGADRKAVIAYLKSLSGK